MKLLIATGNPKKGAELAALLLDQGVEVVTAGDVGGLPEVIEDRDSFSGNAAKKAKSGANHTQLWTLADDSGLEVSALDGAPGVYSARFAGDQASDEENNLRLLAELSGFPEIERGARFMCALALADPEGNLVAEWHGTVSGRILEAPRGISGFGYDPLFLFDEEGQPGQGRTFAELSPEEKSAVSHRGRALAQLVQQLPHLLQATH